MDDATRSPKRTLTSEYRKDNLFRVLSLDGGGAKGFYTLGVLKEIEGFLGCPLYQCFDLIFGTSTGSIIASLLALGYEVDEIHGMYRQHVPSVIKPWLAAKKSQRRTGLAADLFRQRHVPGRENGHRGGRHQVGHREANDLQGERRTGSRQEGDVRAGVWGRPSRVTVQASCSAYLHSSSGGPSSCLRAKPSSW